MNLQMLSMSKMKNNHLYLKILLILLGGDISLNLGPVNRHQIKDHKFDVFTNKDKELRLLHLKDTYRKKKHPQTKLRAYKKYEYGHLCSWCIKSTLYKRLLN